MEVFKSLWGPTGTVMLPAGKGNRKVSYTTGLVEANNKEEEAFLEKNPNFVGATKADIKAALPKGSKADQGDGDEGGEGDEVDLSKMNKEDLIAYAKENEVEIDEAATKADIIEVIEEALED